MLIWFIKMAIALKKKVFRKLFYMNYKIILFSLLALTIVSFGALLNSSNSNQLFAQKIDAYLQSYGDFSGAVLVAQKGEIVISRSYGWADYESKIANTPQTKFKIASITKSFTALAIMQLQEKDLLHVQDPIAKYIPDYQHGNTITIHHLLTHTSGIANYYKRFNELEHCSSCEEMVTIFKSWPLEFEVGSAYAYSNTGYLLLAYLIEKVSGQSYNDFLSENIFKPLGMNNTGSYTSETNLKNCAHGYLKENNEIKKAPPIVAPLTLQGNGNLYSTLEDMYRYNQALLEGKFVSKGGLDCMFAPHVTMASSSKRAHGYGWFIDELRDKKIIEYSGWLRGFLSKNIINLDDNISIIILSNLENLDQFSTMCDDISALMFETLL